MPHARPSLERGIHPVDVEREAFFAGMALRDFAVEMGLPETAARLAIPDFHASSLVGVAERGIEAPDAIGVVIAARRHVPGRVHDHLLPGVGAPTVYLTHDGSFRRAPPAPVSRCPRVLMPAKLASPS